MAIGDPSWPEILEGAVRKQLAAVHTSLPGEIVDYDATTQRATVRLGLTHDGETMPNLPDVPVLWPGGASGFMHGELNAGDGVLVLFCEESFGQWDVAGGTQDPGLLRRHGLHATAIPGFRREGKAFDVQAAISYLTGTEVRLGANDASDFVALSSLVSTQLQVIVDAINNAVPGVSDGGLALHNTMKAGLLTFTGDVKAAKVKAK